MSRRLVCALSLTTAIAGCAHEQAAEPATETATSEPPAATAQPQTAEPKPSGPRTQVQPDALKDRMFDHFWAVTVARDALISGDLDAVRMPLEALAAFRYDDSAPGGWMAWVMRIQQTARATSTASSFETAASGIASMAAECGSCHANDGSGPQFLDSVGHAPRVDPIANRMQGHAWGVDRMWEGLIAPSDEAWRSGARELAEVSREPLDPDLGDETFMGLLDEVRTLSAQAVEAAKPADRVRAYAALLASCAQCHARAFPEDY